MKIAGFDWDSGNWPKCGKHGLSRVEIEQVLLGKPAVMADPHPDEPRMRAIGRTDAGRYVFLILALFALRRHQPAMAALRQARGVDDWSEAR